MKKIIVIAKTDIESKLRRAAFDNALEFEKEWINKIDLGKDYWVKWNYEDININKIIATVYVHHTKTTIVATIIENIQ